MRKGGKEEEREGEREGGGRKGGMEGGMEGGREGRRERGREGGREGGREKLKVVCRKGWTPRSMSSTQTLRICVSSFNVSIVITCERVCGNCWQTALQPCLIIALLCVFTGRHISSYNMVQFKCLSTCAQCSHCSCITF